LKSGGGVTATKWIRSTQAKLDVILPLMVVAELWPSPHYILRILEAEYRCETGTSHLSWAP
jgi:hypothetical protein